MAEMITRCPQCDTAFRITPAHLKSARGSVRCGSCLRVFDARKHLVVASVQSEPQSMEESRPARPEPPRSPESPAAVEPASPEPAQNADDILISDDMDIDSDELSEEFRAAFSDDDDDFLQDTDPAQTSLFERGRSEQPAEEDDLTDDDEAWALKLLDEDEDEDDDQASTNFQSDALAAPAPSGNKYRVSASTDASVADADVDLDVDREAELDAASQQWQPTSTIEANEFDANAVSSEKPEQREPATGATPRGAFSEVDNDADAFPTPPLRAGGDGHSYLDAIEPEPVEFSVRRERTFWRSRLLWGLLSLCALLLLLAQVAWLQYPALSREEPYRSFYAWACNWLGCELPALRDAEAIRTSNLVVRSHPRLDNALMVDVILQNTASFSQPFPVLEVTFSDLQSQVVAQRRFGPDEYLGGELAGQGTMPVRQPVHIALEILDPGSEAVNYRISVVDSE